MQETRFVTHCIVVLLACSFALVACQRETQGDHHPVTVVEGAHRSEIEVNAPPVESRRTAIPQPVSTLLRRPPVGTAKKILEGARIQAKEAAVYTVGYFSLDYPGGDLPRNQGVCTDVIVRALRHAGYDLQVLIHEDMEQAFSAYPQKWGLKKPDANIDHRRVPNQKTFFSRHGVTCPLSGDWQPGDFIYWDLGNGIQHCGVITDRVNGANQPLVIHNIDVCREEDVYSSWRINGHFRFPRAREK